MGVLQRLPTVISEESQPVYSNEQARQRYKECFVKTTRLQQVNQLPSRTWDNCWPQYSR